MGQSPPSESYNNNGEGFPFLQGKAEFYDIFPQNIKFTTQPLKIGRAGSVLLSVRAPVGGVNLADKDYCIGRGLASISFINGNNRFLFYQLKYCKPLIEKEGTGTIFKSISKSKIENLQIPLPPLPIQQKIAEILSAVDDKIHAEEKKTSTAKFI